MSERKKKLTSKKNTRAKKNASDLRNLKKEIRQAVEEIPAMLAKVNQTPNSDNLTPDGVRLSELGVKNQTPTNNYVHIYNTSTAGTKSKKLLLWLGVGTVTALIFAMWMWNMRTIFLDLKPWQSQEASLWQKAKLDLSEIWQNNKLEDGLKEINIQDQAAAIAIQEETNAGDQEKIKESLKVIFAASATNSTNTTSSTITTNTSPIR